MDLKYGPPRKRQLVAARVEACHALSVKLGLTLKEIAAVLHYKNHSSVYAHLRKEP